MCTSLLHSLLQLRCTTNQNWWSRNVITFGKLLRQCSSKQRICSKSQNADVTELATSAAIGNTGGNSMLENITNTNINITSTTTFNFLTSQLFQSNFNLY